MSDRLSTLADDPSAIDALARTLGLASLEVYREISSTQDRAKELGEDGALEWTVVVADHQTAGRGQHGRSWAQAPGASLSFSVLLRPPLASMGLLPVRTGIALASALKPLLSPITRPMIKWPNDLVVADRKVGGILCEGSIRGDICQAVVGVGINVASFMPTLDRTSVLSPGFLSEHLRAGLDRLDIMTALLEAMRSAPMEKEELTIEELAFFATADWLFGRDVEEPSQGRAAGIREDGQLVVTDRIR